MRDYREISFLSMVGEITPVERRMIKAKISSWPQVSKYLQTMDLDEVRKACLIELEDDKRLHILHRLKSRINVLTTRETDAELVDSIFINDMKL
jgi:hypothetical protein